MLFFIFFFQLSNTILRKTTNEFVKTASKRVESQACLNYPEREQFRRSQSYGMTRSKLCNETVKAME